MITPTVTADTHCPPDLMLYRLVDGIYQLDDDGQIEKRCGRCREYFPADDEFFYTAPSEPDGLHCWCRACVREYCDAKKVKSADAPTPASRSEA